MYSSLLCVQPFIYPLFSALIDLNDNSSVFGFDHCDRLLDAMDAQLEQLQVCDSVIVTFLCMFVSVHM